MIVDGVRKWGSNHWPGEVWEATGAAARLRGMAAQHAAREKAMPLCKGKELLHFPSLDGACGVFEACSRCQRDRAVCS